MNDSNVKSLPGSIFPKVSIDMIKTKIVIFFSNKIWNIKIGADDIIAKSLLIVSF
jgi:hypothetical protein